MICLRRKPITSGVRMRLAGTVCEGLEVHADMERVTCTVRLRELRVGTMQPLNRPDSGTAA